MHSEAQDGVEQEGVCSTCSGRGAVGTICWVIGCACGRGKKRESHDSERVTGTRGAVTSVALQFRREAQRWLDNGQSRGRWSQQGRCGKRKGADAWDPDWERLTRADF